MDAPAESGKYAIEFALPFALILGWAFGAGVERMWRKDDPERELEPWYLFVSEALGRIFAGIPLFFVAVLAVWGLEALGVGLGSR